MERLFPILSPLGQRPEEKQRVPWDFVASHEAQALKNHGQTLERLAERGGLSWGELLDVLESRRWGTTRDEVEAERLVRAKMEKLS